MRRTLQRSPLPTRLILERMYGFRPLLPAHRRWWDPRPLLARYRRGAKYWVRRKTWRLVFASLVIGAWVAAHIYYYNRLIDLEFNVKAAHAQIEVAQLKRNHIIRSLTRILHYYSAYEGGILKGVTKLRNQGEKPNPVPPLPKTSKGASPEALLSRLFALSEAYPDLKLTKTAEKFSDAIVNSETDVAAWIMQYNNSVNMYTTVLERFPGDIFGRTMGFKPYPFYKPEPGDNPRYQIPNL